MTLFSGAGQVSNGLTAGPSETFIGTGHPTTIELRNPGRAPVVLQRKVVVKHSDTERWADVGIATRTDKTVNVYLDDQITYRLMLLVTSSHKVSALIYPRHSTDTSGVVNGLGDSTDDYLPSIHDTLTETLAVLKNQREDHSGWVEDADGNLLWMEVSVNENTGARAVTYRDAPNGNIATAVGAVKPYAPALKDVEGFWVEDAQKTKHWMEATTDTTTGDVIYRYFNMPGGTQTTPRAPVKPIEKIEATAVAAKVFRFEMTGNATLNNAAVLAKAPGGTTITRLDVDVIKGSGTITINNQTSPIGELENKLIGFTAAPLDSLGRPSSVGAFSIAVPVGTRVLVTGEAI